MNALASTVALVAAAPGRAETEAMPHVLHYGMIALALIAIAVLGLAQLRESPQPSPRRPDEGSQTDRWTERVVVPVALVSSAAAAGGHAAMTIPHVREGVLFGLFFVVVAAFQLSWAALLVTRRSRALLVVGALVNVLVIAVYGVSRTIGLLAEPEPVGAWDLACGGWELAVVVACAVLLRKSSRTRVPVASWRDWHRSVRAYAGGSVLLIAALVATATA
jgi:hypothetical protein